MYIQCCIIHKNGTCSIQPCHSTDIKRIKLGGISQRQTGKAHTLYIQWFSLTKKVQLNELVVNYRVISSDNSVVEQQSQVIRPHPCEVGQGNGVANHQETMPLQWCGYTVQNTYQGAIHYKITRETCNFNSVATHLLEKQT